MGIKITIDWKQLERFLEKWVFSGRGIIVFMIASVIKTQLF